MCLNIACCASFCACKCCGDMVGSTLKQITRVAYVIFDALFVALALVIIYGVSHTLVTKNSIIKLLTNHVECPQDQLQQCLGISSVFRISMCLVGLHLFVLFWLLWRNGCSKLWNEGMWLIKFVAVLGGFVGLFFVSNDVFTVYAKVAMALSLVFILFQIVMIIDLFYLWGNKWKSRYDEGKTAYAIPLIGFTIILYAAAIYGIVRSFIWFKGCGVGTLGASITVGLIGLATILVLLGVHPNGSLLTTGGVAAYSVLFMWSGLSNMDETCNPLLNKESTTIANLVIGLFIIVVALLYVSLGSSKKNSDMQASVRMNVVNEVLANDDGNRQNPYQDEELGRVKSKNDRKHVNKQENKEKSLDRYKDNGFIYFHIIMVFASLYISMVLTNWGEPVVKGETFLDFQANKLSLWIKLGASWATLGLYNWTLIAPRIFPNRQFA